ncbi:MAG: hypothetical protein AB7N65_09860, partial [Vicinamibacterales bacterium]
ETSMNFMEDRRAECLEGQLATDGMIPRGKRPAVAEVLMAEQFDLVREPAYDWLFLVVLYPGD